MIPSIELNKRIYQVLKELDVDVYDFKPTEPDFPFVEIGAEIELDADTKTDCRTTHDITIHAFTLEETPFEIKQLNHEIKNKIKKLNNVEGFQVDYIHLTNLLTLSEPNNNNSAIYHAVLQFEVALTKN